MSRSLFLLVFVAVVAVATPALALDPATCMDCVQKQTVHHRQDGSVYYTSDGMCCNYPCFGYGSYDLADENVGFGCLTCQVNNELVVGDICCSSERDTECNGTRDPGDSSGCVRNETGVCPAWCTSCP